MRLAGIGLRIVWKSGDGGVGKGVGGGERQERYWGEVSAVHLSGQRNRLKVQVLWYRVMLVNCCGLVMNQDSALYHNPLESGSFQRRT